MKSVGMNGKVSHCLVASVDAAGAAFHVPVRVPASAASNDHRPLQLAVCIAYRLHLAVSVGI
jgi:hypothetical protein